MILAPVAQHFFYPCTSDVIRKSVSAIWRWPADPMRRRALWS